MKASLRSFFPLYEEESAYFFCRFSHLMREIGISCLRDGIEFDVTIDDEDTDFYVLCNLYYYHLGMLDGCTDRDDLRVVVRFLLKSLDVFKLYLDLIDSGLSKRNASMDIYSERYLVSDFMSKMVNALRSL